MLGNVTNYGRQEKILQTRNAIMVLLLELTTRQGKMASVTIDAIVCVIVQVLTKGRTVIGPTRLAALEVSIKYFYID